MDVIGILGLLVGVAILAVLAYNGVGALPLSLLAGLVVILTNRMPVWESYSQFYMGGYVAFIKANFLLFAVAALYAHIMEISGAASAIAYKFIDWFGKKRVMLILYLAACVLTYGGVSVFVIMFALRPIQVVLCKEANLPLPVSLAATTAGTSAITLTTVPGTPSLTNLIPTRYLGTTLTAAPVMGIIATVIMGLANWWYCVYAEKKSREKGEGFQWNAIIKEENFKTSLDRENLPAAAVSFIPLLIVVFINIGFRNMIADATLLVIIAMGISSILGLTIWYPRFKGGYKALFNNGLGGATAACAGPCGVVAFGALVSNSVSFAGIVSWITTFQMNPYITGPLATAIICGVTGSSSGGITIAMETFSKWFLESGANPEIMHRLCAVAAGSLDTLPHAAGIFLSFAVMGLNHKNSYKHIFWTSVAVPAVTCIILVTGTLLIGL